MAEYVTIEGALKWCKVDPSNPEPPFGAERSGKWSTVIYPSKDAVEMIRDLQSQGLKNVLKKDEDGYFVKFSRPCEKWKENKATGEFELVNKLTPVKVSGAEPKEIGNGSLASIKLEVYEHGVPGSSTRKAKAARLFAVDITRLTPRT